MKSSIKTILCLIFFISGAVAQIKPVTTESIFQFDGNEYKIKVKVRDAANSSGHGQIISYSVYLNNKFIHPSEWDGGNITGCRYPYTELKDNFSISTLEADNISIGWIISTGGICGNTKSSKLVFIIPPLKYDYGNYHEYELLAKQEPIIRNNNGKIEIWYIYQEWGLGITSTSIFVPQKIIIDPSKKYKYEMLSKGNVLNGILEIDTNVWGYYNNHFLNLYVAGLNDLNIELMEYSLNNLYKSDETDWYNRFFGGDIQISKNYFTNIINDMKVVQSMDEKYKWYTNWKLPSVKENNQNAKEPTGSYKNGLMVGLWEYYYNNGKLKAKGTYKVGKENGKWTYWHKNGNKSSEGTYKAGQKDGLWTLWNKYDDGKKSWEGTYKDGKKIRTIKWDYYENGQKKKEFIYGANDDKGNSIKNGIWTFWYENGQKMQENTFKDNEFIESKCWDEDGNDCECKEWEWKEGEWKEGCK